MNTSLASRGLPWLAAMWLPISVAACGSGASQPPAGNAAAEVSAAWAKAFDAGDPAALTALYADDARSLPPSGPPLVGRGQIESYWRGDIGEGGVTTTLSVDDAVADGNLLHVEGNYQVKGSSGPELVSGQYQQLWRREGDGWRVEREMWRINPTLQRDIAVAQRLTVSWIAAYNKQDSKALARLYHDDAVVSTMQEGNFEGPAAIEAFWMGDFGDGKPSSALTLTDAYLSGEMAHLEGEYKVADRGKTTEGRYVQLWMRDGNDWRIHREMWLR
jgi:ketosteroid isomerase-like protein